MDLSVVAASLIATSLGAVFASMSAWFTSRFSKRSSQEAAEAAERLNRLITPDRSAIEEVLRAQAEVINIHMPEGQEKLSPEVIKQAVKEALVESEDREALAAAWSREANARALAEVYGQALAQARSSFRLSLTFASLGAMILLLGVGLAIWKASSGGDQIASIVTTGAGLVTNVTGTLFFVQSNRSRQHLERMALQLRADVRQDERVTSALAVIDKVEDPPKRDSLRSRVVAHLLGDATAVLEPPPSAIVPNGAQPTTLRSSPASGPAA
jgi:hypothetical protein